MSESIVLKLIVGLGGAWLVIYTLISAIRTFVLPRGENVPITRWVFQIVYFLFFRMRVEKARTYEQRDRALSFFAPSGLLVLPLISTLLILLGYSGIYWAMGIQPWESAITHSGSTLLTLGTVPFTNFGVTLVMFTEATLGLGLVALLISYLPTMYSAFSRREETVSMLEVRAGAPPSAVEMIIRLHRIRGLDPRLLNETWEEWEVWFTELEESHTSFLPLVFFRSQKAERSWITAAGAILDAAALIESTVGIQHNPQAQLTIRAGFLALRSICDVFRLPYPDDPQPDDPISISREEFDEVCDELHAAGVPLKPDRDQAWADFAGWRVNYDVPLLRLARLIQAPYAVWVSDRSLPQVYTRTK